LKIAKQGGDKREIMGEIFVVYNILLISGGRGEEEKKAE
jgi:hypothetical protein